MRVIAMILGLGMLVSCHSGADPESRSAQNSDLKQNGSIKPQSGVYKFIIHSAKYACTDGSTRNDPGRVANLYVEIIDGKVSVFFKHENLDESQARAQEPNHTAFNSSPIVGEVQSDGSFFASEFPDRQGEVSTTRTLVGKFKANGWSGVFELMMVLDDLREKCTYTGEFEGAYLGLKGAHQGSSGSPDHSAETTDASTVQTTEATADWNQEDNAVMTDVPVVVLKDDQSVKSGETRINDFILKITGCSSGFSPILQSSSKMPVSSVGLYTGDGLCVAGLTSFKWEGEAYTSQTPLTKGGAFFTNGVRRLYVRVDKQLAATVSSGEKAIFIVSELEPLPDYFIYGYRDSSSVGLTVTAIEAPHVRIPENGIKIIKMNEATGVATFSVKIECINAAPLGSTSCQTPGGENQSIFALRAKLIPNRANGITYQEAAEIMSSGTVSASAQDPASPDTQDVFQVELLGSGPLSTNKDMLLLLEYTDAVSGGQSYRYFPVSVVEPE